MHSWKQMILSSSEVAEILQSLDVDPRTLERKVKLIPLGDGSRILMLRWVWDGD